MRPPRPWKSWDEFSADCDAAVAMIIDGEADANRIARGEAYWMGMA